MTEAKDNWRDWIHERFEQQEAAWKLNPLNNEATSANSPTANNSDNREAIELVKILAAKLGVKVSG